MQLHELQPITKKKKVKRVGRGGKRGTYSGRGQKGQRARAGHKIMPEARTLLLRIPKLRGVKNRSLKEPPLVLNVSRLDRVAKEALINKKVLHEKGLINNLSDEVKVLADGELDKAFTVQGLKVSQRAREKIEKAGGKVSE